MHCKHVSGTALFNNLDNNDPSTIIQDRINEFAKNGN